MDDQAHEPADLSSDLDLVTVFECDGVTAEMEALDIQAVLESNGIPAVIVGTSTIPSLPFQVRVPREHVEQALISVAEAQAAGPAGAEEAEQAGEQGPQS